MTRKQAIEKFDKVLKDWEDNPRTRDFDWKVSCYNFCPVKKPVRCFAGEEIKTCPIYNLVVDMHESDFIMVDDTEFKLSMLEVISRKDIFFCSKCGKKLEKGKNIPEDFHLPFCNNCRVELAEQVRKECEERTKP
jgi:hypothetical protein